MIKDYLLQLFSEWVNRIKDFPWREWFQGLSGDRRTAFWMFVLMGMFLLFIVWAANGIRLDDRFREAVAWNSTLQEQVDGVLREGVVAARTMDSVTTLYWNVRDGELPYSIESNDRLQKTIESNMRAFNKKSEDIPLAPVAVPQTIMPSSELLFKVECTDEENCRPVALNPSMWDRTPPKLASTGGSYRNILGTSRVLSSVKLRGISSEFVFDPSSGEAPEVSLDAPGLAIGKGFEVTGGGGELWRLAYDVNGQSVRVSGDPFLVNGSKSEGEHLLLGDEILTLGTRSFILVREEKGPVLAYSKKDGNTCSRIYPYGEQLPIVGPRASGQGGSVGVEAIFEQALDEAKADENDYPEVRLSIDPVLQWKWNKKMQELAEENLGEFKQINAQLPPGDRYDSVLSEPERASFCLMNARTGEVLVLAQSNDRVWDPNKPAQILKQWKTLEQNRPQGLKNHVWGSVSKIPLSFTALQLYPYLHDLTIDNTSDRQTLYGLDFGTELEHHGPRDTDFNTYVARSDNVFHAFLALSALLEEQTGEAFYKALKGGGRITLDHGKPVVHLEAEDWESVGGKHLSGGRLKNADKARLFKGLRILFDLPLEVEIDDTVWWDKDLFPGRSEYEKHLSSSGALVAFPQLAGHAPEGFTEEFEKETNRDDGRLGLQDNAKSLRSYLMGAQFNMINDVKICEMYSRIVTGLHTEATFLARPEKYEPTSMADAVGPAFEQKTGQPYDPEMHAWMREALAGVVMMTSDKVGGTAYNEFNPVLEGLPEPWRDIRLYSKTGTIKPGPKRPNSVGYVFVVGYPDGDGFQGDVFTGYCFLSGATDIHKVKKHISENLVELLADLYPAQGGGVLPGVDDTIFPTSEQ